MKKIVEKMKSIHSFIEKGAITTLQESRAAKREAAAEVNSPYNKAIADIDAQISALQSKTESPQPKKKALQVTGNVLTGTGKTLQGVGQAIAFIPNQIQQALRTLMIPVAVAVGASILTGKTIDDATEYLDEHDGIVGVTTELITDTKQLVTAMKLDDVTKSISNEYNNFLAGPNCTAEDYKKDTHMPMHDFNQESCEWEINEEKVKKVFPESIKSPTTDHAPKMLPPA